jgi:hypothetical protein
MLAKTLILMMLVPSAVLSTYAQSKPNNDQRQMKELFSGSYSDASLIAHNVVRGSTSSGISRVPTDCPRKHNV